MQDEVKLFRVPMNNVSPFGRAAIVMGLFSKYNVSSNWVSEHYVDIVKGIDNGSLTAHGDIKKFINKSNG